MDQADRDPSGEHTHGAASPTGLITVGGRRVGEGNPCFVIAEAGVNHNGDPALAERLVDAAADAGADAVKFQTFDADELADADAPKADYQKETMGVAGDQRSMLRTLALPTEAWAALQSRARRRGIAFLSTPFDEKSTALLASLDVPAFKISSGDVTNHLLLACVGSMAATKNRPVILSTGMSTLSEVGMAVEVLRDAGSPALALLHCVSQYPAPPADCNLHAMDTLRRRFRVPVGFSDHTLGIEVALAAVALGASIVEKHVTLDRNLAGPDHRASLEASEFTAMVRAIRTIESALGDGEKKPMACEQGVARVARRSLYWRVALKRGSMIRAEHFVALRPGGGRPAVDIPALCRRSCARDVVAGTAVLDEDLA